MSSCCCNVLTGWLAPLAMGLVYFSNFHASPVKTKLKLRFGGCRGETRGNLSFSLVFSERVPVHGPRIDVDLSFEQLQFSATFRWSRGIRRVIALASRLVPGPWLWAVQRRMLYRLVTLFQEFRLIPITNSLPVLAHAIALRIVEIRCEISLNH